MKTKLLALALLAGSSMFAETRFSIGINAGGYNRGYYQAAPGYGNRQAYRGYVQDRDRDFDRERFENRGFRRDRDDDYDRCRERREDRREEGEFRNR